MVAPLILVCDDVRNIATLISLHLEAGGYRTRVATCALEAVSLARKETPALILMDVMMPGMDGAMASELLHGIPELKGVPVILLSAMPEDQLRDRAEESGAQGWLPKPFTKRSLMDIVRRHAPAQAS